MTLRVVFDRDDLQRVRIAAQPDPMWELVLSLHRAREQQTPGRYEAWREQARLRVRGREGARCWLAPLFTLVPGKGNFPDFLTPAPLVTELEAGLAELHGTPPARLRHDLAAAFDGDGDAPSTWLRGLAAGDREQVDGVVGAVRQAHEVLLAPQWNEVCEVVRADHTARARMLAAEGLGRVLSGMPGVRGWDGTTLEVDYPCTRTVRLAGRGLTFLPSYFCVGRPVTFIDPELPPVLIYPAAGGSSARSDSTRLDALDALLSRTRAECLGALTTPRTTSALARAVGVSIATASKQATVLRQAKLVESVRDGNFVRHQATELGLALLAGGTG